MEDLPINRLRTLSNLRSDDSFFYNHISRKVAEEILEENEDKYGENALESCVKSGPSHFTYFEYLNCSEIENN